MHSLVYMLSRNILTYVLFRSTRAVMQYGARTVGELPEKLKLWECSTCDKLWAGDSDGDDHCDYCGDKLVAKHRRYDDSQNKDEELMAAI